MDHRSFLRQDYGLINPLQLDPGQLRAIPSTPLIPKRLGANAYLMPHLVVLRDLPEVERLRILDASDTWQSVYGSPIIPVLIRSSDEPNILAEKLRINMLAHHPNHTWYWLRLHDPRVLRHLRWIMNAAQLQRLIGSGATWIWFDEERQSWSKQECPQAGQDESLAFDAGQWDRIFRLEILNRVLKEVGRARPGSTMDDRLFKNVDQIIAEAVDIVGIRDLDDQVAYVKNSIIYGPSFHERLGVRECMVAVRAGEVGYISSVAPFERDILLENDLAASLK